jgi:hypothetical protein
MRNLHSDSELVRVDNDRAGDGARHAEGLPNRLLTARVVARFVGCHEETVRRAYWRGLLRSQRFGVRGRGFTRKMSSTGLRAERQLESREPKPKACMGGRMAIRRRCRGTCRSARRCLEHL